MASLVLNYGRAELSARAVESLARSDLPRQRVLLIDNGSPDARAAREAAGRWGAEFLPLERNYGFGEGMNRGAAEAILRFSPDLLFLLNNDARVEPGALTRLVESAQAERADLAGPKVLLEEEGGAGVAAGSPPRLWAAGGALARWRLLAQNRGEGEEDRGQHDAPGEVPFLSACALLVRRSAWEALGGFERRFFLYQEDADLCLRAAARGFRLLYEPRARAHHLGSATGGGEYGPLQSFYRWRNRLLLFARHSRGLHRAFLFGLFFPALAARDLARYAR
ncbi:MAG: glycosyltransferase family 2 protein, partial [Thermoanaerobaculia bacterium]